MMVIPEFELFSVPAHRFVWQAPTIDCVDLLRIADGTHPKAIHYFPLFPPLHMALKLITIRIHPLCYIVDTFYNRLSAPGSVPLTPPLLLRILLENGRLRTTPLRIPRQRLYRNCGIVGRMVRDYQKRKSSV